MSEAMFGMVIMMVTCPLTTLDDTKCKPHKMMLGNKSVVYTQKDCEEAIENTNALLREHGLQIRQYRCDAMDLIFEHKK